MKVGASEGLVGTAGNVEGAGVVVFGIIRRSAFVERVVVARDVVGGPGGRRGFLEASMLRAVAVGLRQPVEDGCEGRGDPDERDER